MTTAMSIDAVRTVDRTGIQVVPDPADYDRVSDGWSEKEYRAIELAEDSLGGLWEGQPGSVFFESWPYTEFCVMISGRVAVIDADGARREFGAGEAFVVPRGFRGTWETVEPSVKYFVAMR